MAPTAWRTLIGHMLTVDKHLIPFTGADRHNDSLVISGRPKGGTYQFRPGYAAFLDSTRMPFAQSGLPTYMKSSKKVFYKKTNYSRHIHLAGKRDPDNSNKMERLSGTRDHEVSRGLKRFDILIDGLKTCYNFTKNHDEKYADSSERNKHAEKKHTVKKSTYRR